MKIKKDEYIWVTFYNYSQMVKVKTLLSRLHCEPWTVRYIDLKYMKDLYKYVFHVYMLSPTRCNYMRYKRVEEILDENGSEIKATPPHAP